MEEKERFMLSIDQSTQGTKAILLDSAGMVVGRRDVQHRQIIDEKGWVEHDLDEIWENTKAAVQEVLRITGIRPEQVAGLGVSNQRETVAAWNRKTGEPICHAVVWQCSRGMKICEMVGARGFETMIKEHTGLDLSPYFSASKLAWIYQNVPEARVLYEQGMLCFGTIDAWLVFKMTGGKSFKTDYSNACRTQLFNIHTLTWDEEVCGIFGIPMSSLPQVVDSDALFGATDLGGIFENPLPIMAVMGDSHSALFGQGCHRMGMAKATYGTGSSIMMHIGDRPVADSEGLAVSLAWSRGGKAQYVLEGNINYTGAVITWMQKQLHLIADPAETEELARKANAEDTTYMVPAFTGLGAPYWKSQATALITGMTRLTGKAELVKAGLTSIAYQIRDVVAAMNQAVKPLGSEGISVIRADGGPTRNQYLMQFQADILGFPVEVPQAEELSGIGAAYMAGIGLGFYEEKDLFAEKDRKIYIPQMDSEEREKCLAGWKKAIERTML